MAEENRLIMNFRTRKIKDKILITSDSGSHVFLEKKEYDNILTDNVSDTLYRKLDKSGFLIKNNNLNDEVKRYRSKNIFLFQGTALHIVVPTLRCNLECVYCHASKRGTTDKGYDMDEKTARRTVDFIFQSPSPSITIEFQGGEPLLNFEIVKYIIEYAKEKNKIAKKDIQLSLVSNFTLMTDEKLDYLIKQGVDLCTSLDGPEFLHNKNRPVNSYKLVTRWIKKIQEEYRKRGIKDKRVNALITITKETLKYPEKVVDEYVNQGIGKIHLRFLNNLGDARGTWKRIAYTSDEFMDFWKKAVAHIDEMNKKNKKPIIIERMLDIIEAKVTKDYDPGYLEIRSPCGAVIGQLAYDYDGKIYSCDEGRMIGEDIFMVGNVHKNMYKEVATSPSACSLVMASTNDTQSCDACAYKPYCGLCPVCNYAEQGSIIAKIPETNRCKIYKAQFDHYFESLLNDG